MTREYQVMKLPSGFWAVFYNGEWLTASLKNSDECIKYIADHKKTCKTK